MTRLSADGSQILYSTYFGGSGDDNAVALGVDAFGNLFLAGTTDSDDLPLGEPVQFNLSGRNDAYVARFGGGGSVLDYSTYWGGPDSENMYDLHVDSGGDVYVVGRVNGTSPTVNPIQSVPGGRNDAFLFVISHEDVEPGPNSEANLIFPHFVTGELTTADAAVDQTAATLALVPNRTRIILVNNSDQADAGAIQFRNATGTLSAVLIDGKEKNQIEYQVDPRGTLEIETDGTGQLKSGIIEVISDRKEQSRLEGAEVFEVLGSFVTVNSSSPGKNHQIYVSSTSEENSGVAFYNPSRDNTALVEVTLFNSKNTQKAQKEITLQPRQQLVRFVDDKELFVGLFNNITNDFQGKIQVRVLDEQKIAVIGLLQKRATGALIAVSTDGEGEPGTLRFTQFANGELGTVANRTRIILINNGQEIDAGTIRFQNANGDLSPVPIGGTATDTVNYSLNAGDTTEVETDGTGQIQSGVIEVHSDLGIGSKIRGTEVFEILGNFVSVTNSPLRTSQQVYVSFTSDENTGLAIYNPDPDNSLDLNLILVDRNGEEQTRRQITIGGGKQVVQFVDHEELFKDFFQQNPGDFHGTLNIHALSGMKAAVLGLLQKRSSKALIAVSTSPNAFGAEK
jgi:hypothetical protein